MDFPKNTFFDQTALSLDFNWTDLQILIHKVTFRFCNHDFFAIRTKICIASSLNLIAGNKIIVKLVDDFSRQVGQCDLSLVGQSRFATSVLFSLCVSEYVCTAAATVWGVVCAPEINKSGVKCRAAPSAAATAIRGESEGERERGPCFYLSESKKMIKSRSLMRCGRCFCTAHKKNRGKRGKIERALFSFFLWAAIQGLSHTCVLKR